jgi:hypothetical protein
LPMFSSLEATAWSGSLLGRASKTARQSGSLPTLTVESTRIFPEQAPEEAKLKFANLGDLSTSDAGDRIFEITEQQDAEEDVLVAKGAPT